MTTPHPRLGRFFAPGSFWYAHGAPDDPNDPDAIPSQKPRPITRIAATLAILGMLAMNVQLVQGLAPMPAPQTMDQRIEQIYHTSFCGGDMSKPPSPEIRAHIIEMIKAEDAAKAAKSGGHDHGHHHGPGHGHGGHEGHGQGHDHHGQGHDHDGGQPVAGGSNAPAGNGPAPCCKTTPQVATIRRRDDESPAGIANDDTPDTGCCPTEPKGNDPMCEHGLSYETKAMEQFERFKATLPGQALDLVGTLLTQFRGHNAAIDLSFSAEARTKLASLILKPQTTEIPATITCFGQSYGFEMRYNHEAGKLLFHVTAQSEPKLMKCHYDMETEAGRTGFREDLKGFAALATTLAKLETQKPEATQAYKDSLTSAPPAAAPVQPPANTDTPKGPSCHQATPPNPTRLSRFGRF